MVIQADIKLGEQSIGNLPVIEMQNHELTQEELNGLIDYFTDGEELYMPQMVTKDAYQEVLDRISSKEGSYLQSAYSTSIAGIQNATREGMELAPDEASAPEKMEIKFQKKTERNSLDFQTAISVDACIDFLDSWHGEVRSKPTALGDNL